MCTHFGCDVTRVRRTTALKPAVEETHTARLDNMKGACKLKAEYGGTRYVCTHFGCDVPRVRRTTVLESDIRVDRKCCAILKVYCSEMTAPVQRVRTYIAVHRETAREGETERERGTKRLCPNKKCFAFLQSTR